MVSATSTGSARPGWRELIRRPISRVANGIRAVISVSMKPGATALTVMPRSATCRASAVHHADDAGLARARSWSGRGCRRCPRSRRQADDPAAVGQAAFAEQRVVRSAGSRLRLTAMTLPHRSASMLTSSLSRVMPALCTTTSRPPCRDVACSTIRRPASSAVTSSWRAVPPTSLATPVSASPAAGTSTATTVAPSRARTRAISAPIPRAAPVTTATLPCEGSPSRVGVAARATRRRCTT